MTATGHCLCGAVTFTAETDGEVAACHCAMCRRWGGGPLLALDTESASFAGDGNIGTYRSSDWAERGFCKICGTNLFYRIVQTGKYIIPAGAFHDQTDFRLVSEIFTDEKPGWHDFFSAETARMTGAEVFAKYLGGGA